MNLTYSPQAAGQYQVWRGPSRRIGVVKKIGFRWMALTPANLKLGTYASMSQAGNRLAEEDEKK